MSKQNKCADLYISSDNVLMSVLELENLTIAQRSTLSEAIEIIDTALGDIINDVNFKSRYTNVGGGVAVHKGYSVEKGNELRTFKGDEIIKVTQQGDLIQLTVDTAMLPEDVSYKMRNLGNGSKVFKSVVTQGDEIIFGLRTFLTETLDIVESSDNIKIELKADTVEILEAMSTFVSTDYTTVISNTE